MAINGTIPSATKIEARSTKIKVKGIDYCDELTGKYIHYNYGRSEQVKDYFVLGTY